MDLFIEHLESRQLLSAGAGVSAGGAGVRQAGAALHQPVAHTRRKPAGGGLVLGNYNGTSRVKAKHVRFPPYGLTIQITAIDGTNVQARVLDAMFTGGLGELFTLTGQFNGKTLTLQGGQYTDYGAAAGMTLTVVGKVKGNKISGTITNKNDAPYLPALTGKFKVSR